MTTILGKELYLSTRDWRTIIDWQAPEHHYTFTFCRDEDDPPVASGSVFSVNQNVYVWNANASVTSLRDLSELCDAMVASFPELEHEPRERQRLHEFCWKAWMTPAERERYLLPKAMTKYSGKVPLDFLYELAGADRSIEEVLWHLVARSTEDHLLTDLLEPYRKEFDDSLHTTTLEKLLGELHLRRKGEWTK